jgi:hypothetical protein
MGKVPSTTFFKESWVDIEINTEKPLRSNKK